MVRGSLALNYEGKVSRKVVLKEERSFVGGPLTWRNEGMVSWKAVLKEG